MSPTDGPRVDGRLQELVVRDLGIIREARLLIGEGMTAITGETGAGKTLIVGALDLLLGGRADAGLVRAGRAEGSVEGRFEVAGEEFVVRRVIPSDGRSRAYVDGHLATASSLTERVGDLIDIHGQHAHQSLLAAPVQRRSLDVFAGVDLTALHEARAARSALVRQREELGGDAGSRAREIDLLRFQLAELERAQLEDPNEDDELDAREDRLAGALEHREAAAVVSAALADDGGAIDAVGLAVSSLDGRAPFADSIERLRAVQAELGDLAADVRATGEAIEEDPHALEAVRARRQLLVDLRRKYGTAPALTDREPAPAPGAGTLADVIAYRGQVAARLAELASHDERASALDAAIAEAERAERHAAAAVGAARRAAAPGLAEAVTGHLASLAMAAARFEVAVGDEDPGDDVAFGLAANPGAPVGPLARVASGGELARTMLALRLVLSVAPPVLVFDEVDAGIGGQAALAVGRALADLGGDHQVLVVTHLPQVAAFADAQITVAKTVAHGSTEATATVLDGNERVVELSRMLSGAPDSATTRDAASELLARAASERGR